MLRWLTRRSTGDILVLIIAGTICAGLVVTGASLIVFEFIHPDRPVGAAARLVISVVNTLIGLLAGFLAGRTDAKWSLPPPPQSPKDNVDDETP